jgi:hypothetical protein
MLDSIDVASPGRRAGPRFSRGTGGSCRLHVESSGGGLPEERFAQARILVLEGDQAVADTLRRALVDGGCRSVVVAAECEAQPPDGRAPASRVR